MSPQERAPESDLYTYEALLANAYKRPYSQAALDLLRQFREAVRREALEEAAKYAEARWRRGGAHTYASENAGRYIALEDAAESIAVGLRALAAAPDEGK